MANNYQTNVGAIRDPFAPLQQSLTGAGDLYTKYMQRQSDKEARELEQARLARAEGRAQDKHGILMDTAARDEASRQFMTGYEPDLYTGGKGLDPTSLRRFSDIGGEAIEKMDKVKVGPEGSLVPATAADIADPGVSTFPNVTPEIGTDIEARLGTLSPTQEQVYSSVYKDILQGTKGDTALAEKVATEQAKKFSSKKDVMAQEKAATKEANLLRKELSDRAKYMAKSRGTSTAGSGKSVAKDLGPKKGFVTKDDAIGKIDEMGLGYFDENEAEGLWQMAADTGRDRNIALEALKDNTVRGFFTDDKVDLGRAAYLRKVDELTAQAKKTGSGRTKSAITHTPAELAMIQSTPQQARTYREIQQGAAEEAWKGFGGRGDTSKTKSTKAKTKSVVDTKQEVDELKAMLNSAEISQAVNEAGWNDRQLTLEQQRIANTPALQGRTFDPRATAGKYAQAAGTMEKRQAILDSLSSFGRGVGDVYDYTLTRPTRSLLDTISNAGSPYSRTLLTPEQLEQIRKNR